MAMRPIPIHAQNAPPRQRGCLASGSVSRAWVGWSVAATFYLYDVFLRLTVDVVTSKLQTEFDVGADTVSTAFSSSFFYAYASVQLLVGLTLDYLGPRRTLCFSACLAGGGAFLFGSAQSVEVAMLGRVMSGVGCGCGWLGAIKVTRNSFGSGNHMARLMIGVTCMLGGLGGLASQAPFAALVDVLGWRSAFKVSSVLAALVAVGALLFVDDRAMGNGSGHDEDSSVTAPLNADGNRLSRNQIKPVDDGRNDKTLCQILKKVVTTPRIWLYALYLGGTDAPFETFAGLWGVPFLHQSQGWEHNTAAQATSMLVIVATGCQLAAGPLLSVLKGRRASLTIMCGLALLGGLCYLPFVLANTVSTYLAYACLVGLGVTVGSCTLIWAVISSDPLCQGSETTGMVSGAANTLCIAIDAAMQQLVGAILAANWDGKTVNITSTDGVVQQERVYSKAAFGIAFTPLMVSFGVAASSMILLLLFDKKCQRN